MRKYYTILIVTGVVLLSMGTGIVMFVVRPSSIPNGTEMPEPEPNKAPGEPSGLEREALISKIESSSDFNRGVRVPWQGDIEAYILAHPQDEEIKERWTLFKRYKNYVYDIRDIENKTGKEYKQIFEKRRGQEADLTSAQKAYIRNLKEEYYERASKKWPKIQFIID